MKSFSSLISLVLALVCLSFSTTSAFVMRPSANAPSLTVSTAPSTTSITSLNVFGSKKSQAQKEAEAEKAAMYWEGEWVCKDCGYIYQRVRIESLWCDGTRNFWFVEGFCISDGFQALTILFVLGLFSYFVCNQFNFWNAVSWIETILLLLLFLVRMCQFVFRRTKPWFPMPSVLRTSSSICEESRRSCWNHPRWRRCPDPYLQFWRCDSYYCVWYLGRRQLVNWSNYQSIYSNHRAIYSHNTPHRDFSFPLVLPCFCFQNSWFGWLIDDSFPTTADDISICADHTTTKRTSLPENIIYNMILVIKQRRARIDCYGGTLKFARFLGFWNLAFESLDRTLFHQ